MGFTGKWLGWTGQWGDWDVVNRELWETLVTGLGLTGGIWDIGLKAQLVIGVTGLLGLLNLE